MSDNLIQNLGLIAIGPIRKSAPSTNTKAALRDLNAGLKLYELWTFLGWREVKKHYSRSVLGPFWLTLSMGVLVAALGILYAQIFQMDISDYLPFLAIGFIMWGLIGGSITGACTIFSAQASSIRQIALPLSVYMYQFIWMQIISFAHNFVIYILVAIFFGIWPGWVGLLMIPALFIIVLNGLFCAMVFGPLCARFRDVPMIIGSLMQIAFFLTPIIWSAEQIPGRAHLVDFNPFYHFIQIARDPLLGQTGTMTNWLACIGITLVFGTIAIAFFSRFRARVAYWA